MKKVAFLAALALVSGFMTWAGEKLEIIKAEYGAADKWSDVTAIVKSKVTDAGLKIDAENGLFQDPAPGLTKILKVTAKVGDKQAVFKCEEHKSIEIKTESFGAVAKAQAESELEIISAEYGAGDKKVNVAEKVRAMVDKGTKKIAATNELFSDPAPGDTKNLTIKYKLGGKEGTVSASENESLDLP